VVARALDHVAVAAEEGAVVGVAVGVEEPAGVVGHRDRRALVALYRRHLARRALDEQHRALVGERRRAQGREAGAVERRPDPAERAPELWVELVVHHVGRVEDDGDRGGPPARDVVADRVGRERRGVVAEEGRDARGRQQVTGVVLEARDLFGGADGRDVALRVGRVDHHERVVERRRPVVRGVVPDRRVPLGRRADQSREAAVFEDEEFGQVAREASRPEVAPVRPHRGEELLRDADVRGQVVDATVEPRGVKGGAVDRRPRVRRRLDVVAGHEVHVEALDRPRDVRVFGVLLVAVGQDRVADGETEAFEIAPREVRRQADEEVDVAVAREPRVAGGGADPHHVRVDAVVRERRPRPVREAVGDRREARSLVGVRPDTAVDPVYHPVEVAHVPSPRRRTEGVSIAARKRSA
jgi:hypothetical protein